MGKCQFVDIAIYDMNGRNVLLQHVSGESRNVKLNFCNDGLYFYMVKDLNGNTARGKILVSK
ncbi:MAG: T9SS type A sorting domain-containing protein [Crocinitomicaceae bacterium]|nr:T9SS type A sorting domain-containing protein [Crocinitomicaceae bacterium]